jgi:hypothetical protein
MVLEAIVDGCNYLMHRKNILVLFSAINYTK